MDAAGRLACELGCAGLGTAIADGLFHGVDTLKVRQHVTPAYTARRALAEAGGGLRGVVSVWTPGLYATCVRAFTYAAVRVGAYPCARDAIAAGGDASFAARVAAGSATGAVAALAFTPLDVLRTRQQLRPHALPALDVLGGLRRIAAGDVASLWRGAGVNVVRASILSAAQLSTYDVAKRELRDRRGFAEGPALHFAAAVFAGAVAQTLIQPFCAIRTAVFSDARPLAEALRRPLFRGYGAGLLRQGPVLALTLAVTERARASLGLAPM